MQKIKVKINIKKKNEEAMGINWISREVLSFLCIGGPIFWNSAKAPFYADILAK